MLLAGNFLNAHHLSVGLRCWVTLERDVCIMLCVAKKMTSAAQAIMCATQMVASEAQRVTSLAQRKKLVV
jgi:hypothetical protein